MQNSTNERSRQYWGKRASRNLLRTFNCPESTLQVAQDMISARDDTLLKSSAALAGGVAACGSTCGVVIGGAMSLALMHDRALRNDGPAAEAGLLSLVGDYVDWFRDQYGTVFCREKAGVDFWTLSGFLRYLIPPDRFFGCLSHINQAMQYLHDRRDDDLPAAEGDGAEETAPGVHCARTVLEEVRKRTDVGDPLMERVSVVFDGGVGLRGGACGALIGAIIPISALMWIDLREASWVQAYLDMLIGLRKLRTGDLDKPDDPYAVAGKIATRFKSEAGSLDCSVITGKAFGDWDSFRAHMGASDRCSSLIGFCVNEASTAIDRYQGAR